MNNLSYSKKKKVLLVTRPIAPPWDEASKNFAYNLALNSPDFEFGLLTNGKLDNLPLNIKIHPIYSSNKNNLTQKIKLTINLRRIAAGYDIVQCLFTPTKINSYLLINLLKGKKIIQTIATLREDLFSDQDLKKLMFGDLLITYSKYSRDKLVNLGFHNVEQIYPGIDLELYKPAVKDEKLLATLNLRSTDFIITFPGEFTRLEAIDDILNMIYQYTSILVANNIKIVFACRVKNTKDHQKKEKIKKILKEKKIIDLVRLPETFTTLDKMLNTSDVVIFPVRNMQGKFDVPLVVIEAMACGRPVIISDLPILGEFSNLNNSVIIRNGDTKQLFEAILNLQQNKKKRELLCANARKFVEENFDIKIIAEKYKNIYNRI